MKKPILWLIISSFIFHAGFSDPYVWQDYDDFSGSSLDTRKWEIGYSDGAQAPNIENGKAHLYGTGVGVGSIVPPSFDELVGMPQNGTNQSFLFLKDDLISGVEAEISLDSTYSGIYLGIMESVEGGSAYAGIELNSWKQSGPSLEFSNTVYENGTETLESTLGDKPASLEQSYKVSVVKGESAYQLFLDSELIGEYPVRGELLFFVFGGYHDEDLPWDGYIDNVRVISDWEDYEDFSGSNIDTDRWSMGHWDGGNLPVIENERLTLSGNTISGFKEVLPTNGMLELDPDIKPLLEEGFSSSNGTESHSMLELLKDDILGIEVEVQLPVDAPSSTAIGLYASDWAKAFSEDQSDKSFFGLDLWRNHIDIEYVDPNTGEFISNDLSTTPGSTHTFAFIFEDGKVFMFVDGEKVAEFSSANFSRDAIVIRAWNNAGEPFSAYAENVRIVRNWKDYDDFSSGSLDSSKWEVAWFKGGRAPTVVNGALQLGGSGDPNDPASDSMPYQLSLLDIPESMATHPFTIITDSSVYGLEAEIMLPSGSQYSTGLNFLCWDTTSQTADGSFKQFGPEIEYWSGQKPSLDYQYLDPSTDEVVEVSLPAEFGVYYKASLIQDGLKSLIFIDGEKVAEFEYPEFSPNAYGFFAFNDDGLPFETYVKNVRVLRRSQTSEEPDPVNVVSDPNGQAVVVQVGDEYQWNSTLDGVTLWGVWEDSEDGWIGATVAYENGVQKASIGLTDELGSNLEVNHPYIIDENGMIKVTEDTAFQYYQVTAVENGVITTADDSSFPLSDTSKFFTTRSAAEEYYYSKANPKDWMWFDYYPWVYSEEEQGWLYFYPSGGKLLYYSNKSQVWREFNQ